MKHIISECAGKIWHLLQDKPEMNVVQIPRVLKEKTVVVYQALGWLAREDKVEYQIEGDKIMVSLTPHERQRG